MDNIGEFAGKDKPESYHTNLVRELKKLDEKLHAFNLINEDIGGGFPISVKDNICVKGFEATAGSKILKGYIPPFNATCVEKILGNDYGFLGKTSMEEFGFGSLGINTEVPPRNPFDEKRVAGGSSAGAAVATSILRYHAAICESTGGSISDPASFCGVVGFTPTYGVVSRYGLIDYANSLDKIGIMARSSRDIRGIFDIIKGSDRYDTTCVDEKITDVKRKKLVVINQLMEGIDEEIKSSFDLLLGKLQNLGYKIEYVDLDFIEKAIPAYYIISMAEASTNLAKYTGFKYGYIEKDFTKPYNEFFTDARANFGSEAKRRIAAGTFVRSASVKKKYYYKALKVRRAMMDRLSKILGDAFIISPTMPIKAPTFEEAEKLKPVQTYAIDILTVPSNLSGLPHISFPMDYIKGMPTGAQITTNYFNDYALLDFVDDWEKSFKYRFKYNLGEI